MKKFILAAAMIAIGSAATARIHVEDNVLIIEGSITSSSGIQFSNHFSDDITHIQLRSNGGSVSGGTMISEMIYKNRHRLTTEATGDCLSMCGMIFLAADKHVYNPDGVVGLHLSYSSNSDFIKKYMFDYGSIGLMEMTKKQVLTDIAKYAKYINSHENFQEFIEELKEKGISRKDMWRLTTEEILKYEGNDAFSNPSNARIPEPPLQEIDNVQPKKEI